MKSISTALIAVFQKSFALLRNSTDMGAILVLVCFSVDRILIPLLADIYVLMEDFARGIPAGPVHSPEFVSMFGVFVWVYGVFVKFLYLQRISKMFLRIQDLGATSKCAERTLCLSSFFVLRKLFGLALLCPGTAMGSSQWRRKRRAVGLVEGVTCPVCEIECAKPTTSQSEISRPPWCKFQCFRKMNCNHPQMLISQLQLILPLVQHDLRHWVTCCSCKASSQVGWRKHFYWPTTGDS